MSLGLEASEYFSTIPNGVKMEFIFSLSDTIGVGFSLYQGVVGGRGKIFQIGPSPRCFPQDQSCPPAPAIALCLKES